MSGKGKTLLIIDDSPFIITGLLHQLEGLPAIQKVYTAESYTDAQPILKSSPPDILLLDIHLPDVNGIEILRRVKQLYPSVVVIMISNQEGDVYRSRCKPSCSTPTRWRNAAASSPASIACAWADRAKACCCADLAKTTR